MEIDSIMEELNYYLFLVLVFLDLQEVSSPSRYAVSTKIQPQMNFLN